MSDVTFVVGEPPEQKRFQLHKLILSMNSKVFFTMFHGSFPEMGEVKVPDIQPDIFDITMKYVYEDTSSVESVEQAMYTYCASEKYNISYLRDLCTVYITNNLSSENLSILYRKPAILENLQIKSECKIMLSLYTSDILTSENFRKAPLDMVKDIVQLEDLNVPSEHNLFDLILEWAKSFCLKEDPAYTTKVLRAVMDHFLPHIRFLCMSIHTFVLGPASSDILTDSEISSISRNLMAPCRRELPVWCNRKTSRNITRIFLLEDCSNYFFTGGPLMSIDSYIIIHSGNILFKGFTVYVERVSVLPTLSLEINLVHSRNLKILERNSTETRCSYDAKKSVLKCMLLKPFPVRLSNVYQICVSSNSSIFNLCEFSHSRTSAKRNRDLEMEYRLTRRSIINDNRTISFYPHFHEILYNKF